MRPQIIIVPGWRDSGPAHWQTRWQAKLPSATRVQQADWETPVRAQWVSTLSEHILACNAPVVLAAHSLGCVTVAHLPPRVMQRIAGALLVAPADVERPAAPAVLAAFGPIPQARLPFRSTLVASTDDPYCSLERAVQFAEAWGSRVSVLHGAGHINADSNLGDWAEGLRLLTILRRAAQWPVGGTRALTVGSHRDALLAGACAK